jgi:hypothetical protein
LHDTKKRQMSMCPPSACVCACISVCVCVCVCVCACVCESQRLACVVCLTSAVVEGCAAAAYAWRVQRGAVGDERLGTGKAWSSGVQAKKGEMG